MASALEGQSLMRISLPDKSWSLQIDAPAFEVQQNATRPDGRRSIMATNKTNGMVVSATLERVNGEAKLAGCRKVNEGRVTSFRALNLKNVQHGQIEEFITLEYIIPEVSGKPVNQKNLWACTVKEDVFTDIHISKVSFASEDRALLLAVLASVHFVDGREPALSDPRVSSVDYMRTAGQFYLAGDLQKAIEPFQKALELEKQERKLDPKLWRVLIDNLSMAYGITGDLNASEAVTRYGITQEPEYPMFYYVLACTLAEKGDLDATIENLTKAFSLKKNMMPGEKMPDPRKDDSFKRFLREDKFKKMLKTL